MADVDSDDQQPPALLLDLRDLRVAAEPRPIDGEQAVVLVLGDKQRRVELTPGMAHADEAAVAGAQRLAAAALDYAVGLALLALHGITRRPPDPEAADRPGHDQQT